MFKKIDFQYVISFLGLIPYLLIIIDKYFFFQIRKEIIIDFSIYYTLIIFVFIGSTNWNLKSKVKNHITIYGFLPSFFAVIIIVLNLFSFNYFYLIISLLILLILQLIFDKFFVFNEYLYEKNYYYLRFPLTTFISLFLILIIF